MKFHRRSRTLGLPILVVALVALVALAAPAASARPVEELFDPTTSCERQWARTYQEPAPASCVQQVLASRGTGAPAAGTAPSPSANDPGFDWGAAAAGAGAAGVIALLGWSLVAVSRRRVRTARP